MQMIRRPAMRLTLNNPIVLLIGSFALAFGKAAGHADKRAAAHVRHPDAGFLNADSLMDIRLSKSV